MYTVGCGFSRLEELWRAKYTAQALDDMIKGLKGKGYELVPISKLIYKKNYQMDHEGRQFVVGEEEKVTQ